MKRLFFFVLLSLSMLSLSASSLRATGYGSSVEEAKANALQQLVTQISGIQVSSVVSTDTFDTGKDTAGVYTSKVTVSSSVSQLPGVRFSENRKSDTKEEKSNGKYLSTVEIPDSFASQYLAAMQDFALTIDSTYRNAEAEENLEAKVRLYDSLESTMEDYVLYQKILWGLGYEGTLPSYTSSLTLESVRLEHDELQRKLYSTSENNGPSLRDLLVTEILDSKDKSADIKSTSSSEAAYSRKYKVGEYGPAGGIIVFDKGEVSDGWRYIEAAPSNAKAKAIFSKEGKIATSSAIGKGKENSTRIQSMDDRASTAASIAEDYVYGGFDDWFLPSYEELMETYTVLRKTKGASYTKSGYWCSTSLSSSIAEGISFKNGHKFTDKKGAEYLVRPVRYF